MLRFGSYEVVGELGRGGMGTVYEARHLPTGAPRAVKVLAVTPDAEALARFLRESEALARLHGSGTVAIHESGTDRGSAWFAMDLMRGGSLRDRLRRGSIPWRTALAWTRALAATLERAHAQGLVHRDLKPENVLFDDQDEPRIADWGCVRDAGASSLTETGTLLGTPAYMAPEQLRGERAGPPADVFALGAILWELLAGERPFDGRSILDHHRAIESHALRGRLPRDLPPAIPVWLEGALAFAPGARPAPGALLPGGEPRTRDHGRRGLVVLVLAGVLAAGALVLPRPAAGPPQPNVATVPSSAPSHDSIVAAALRSGTGDVDVATALATFETLERRRTGPDARAIVAALRVAVGEPPSREGWPAPSPGEPALLVAARDVETVATRMEVLADSLVLGPVASDAGLDADLSNLRASLGRSPAAWRSVLLEGVALRLEGVGARKGSRGRPVLSRAAGALALMAPAERQADVFLALELLLEEASDRSGERLLDRAAKTARAARALAHRPMLAARLHMEAYDAYTILADARRLDEIAPAAALARVAAARARSAREQLSARHLVQAVQWRRSGDPRLSPDEQTACLEESYGIVPETLELRERRYNLVKQLIVAMRNAAVARSVAPMVMRWKSLDFPDDLCLRIAALATLGEHDEKERLLAQLDASSWSGRLKEVREALDVTLAAYPRR